MGWWNRLSRLGDMNLQKSDFFHFRNYFANKIDPCIFWVFWSKNLVFFVSHKYKFLVRFWVESVTMPWKKIPIWCGLANILFYFGSLHFILFLFWPFSFFVDLSPSFFCTVLASVRTTFWTVGILCQLFFFLSRRSLCNNSMKENDIKMVCKVVWYGKWNVIHGMKIS